jgi:hypothetical protein
MVERDFGLRGLAVEQVVAQSAQRGAVRSRAVQHRAGMPDDLLGLVPEGTREGLVHIDDRARLVGLALELADHDDIGRVVECDAQQAVQGLFVRPWPPLV